MRKFFTNFASFALLAAMTLGFSGCGIEEKEENDEPEPTPGVVELKASLVSSGVDFFEIKVETSGIDAVAYEMYTSAQDDLQPSSIFRSGKSLDMSGDKTLRIDELTGATTYYFYFAGQIGSAFHDEVFELQATTAEYEVSSSMLTLIEAKQRSFKVHINVPESVEKDETHAIRYAFATLPMYLSNKIKGNHDADLLYQNGQVHTREDITVDINPDNEYLMDENGNFVIDPDTGYEIQLHDPFVPGEPVIFLAGEFEWGEGYIANWGPNGDGFGYFIPLCDLEKYYEDQGASSQSSAMTKGLEPDMIFAEDELPYWYGAYENMVFTLEQPALLDAEMEIVYNSISPINAEINVIPDDNILLYCYTVVDDATYEAMISLLGGREDWMQWFISSKWFRFNFMCGQVSGPAKINVKNDFFRDWLPEQSDFHLLITAIGDEEGTTQKFFHEKFTTTAKQLDPPVVEVTAVENNQNIYEAKFNIKAPNGDLVAAKYGANYVRDWVPELNAGATYASLVQNPLSEKDVEAINSPEGLTISIPSLDGQTTRIAVLGFNEEYTPNILVPGCSAIAECSTRLLPLEPHVNSPLFEELVGDWTATATVWAAEYDSNNQLQYFKKTSKTKISIANKIETPELDQSVYDIYKQFGWDENQVDGYYEDFKAQAKLFNDYRLHYRNRLLCTGWFEKDLYSNPSRLATRTAFDLFKATDYQSYDNAELFYDFGPKWYLEIAEDGTVVVPVNQDAMPPMTFAFDYVFFVGGYDKESNKAFKTDDQGFPVQISADKNTITIKPRVKDSEKYYMNAIAGWSQYDIALTEPVISDIKLTRGWKEEPAPKTNTLSNTIKGVEVTTGDCERVVWKSMTKFPERKSVQFKEVEPNIVTIEQIEAALMNMPTDYQTR